MAKLTDLGFKKGICCETIVSTYNPDGTSNAAPIGLKLLDEQHLSMSIFNTSSTCRNIKEKKCAIVNLTSDIEVFYKSALKEANSGGKVPAEWFVTAKAVEANTTAAIKTVRTKILPFILFSLSKKHYI